jgi:hypothetical protein
MTLAVLAAAAALVTLVSVYQQRWNVAGAAAVVLLVLAMSGISPRASHVIHRAWMAIAATLSYVNSRLLLGASFFLVLTPTSLLMKLTGRDALALKPGGESGWVRRRRRERSDFERAF